MLVTFKTITQQTFQLELDENLKIEDVKKKIAQEKGENDFAVESQKLIYNGKILEDSQQLKDADISDKKFVVVMVSRKKQPEAPATSSAAPAAPAEGEKKMETEQPTPVTNSAPTPTTPSVSTPAASEVPAEHEATVEAISTMGYPRAEVIRALRASFYNADRAVEYLCTGIPENNLGEVPAALQEDEDADEGGTLEFLRENPQFDQIRELVRSQPELLPQIIQQISSSNPELMEAIRDNQAEFVRMLNEEPQGGGAATGAAAAAAPAAVEGGAAPAAGAGGPLVVSIPVTENDRAAINRVWNLFLLKGFVVL
jgi:UV excision repair protein RAD23